MPDPTPTLDFLATWTDTFGTTYYQLLKLAPNSGRTFAEELSEHVAWVCTHHAIACYSVAAV